MIDVDKVCSLIGDLSIIIGFIIIAYGNLKER